ncbi:hypothetical protein BD324DRAFT_649601 [Kockovaella imperatae]|uniref:Uncharacterized protein n=1 Tax=Kockovaella imperatae TaxID=4999 RepID=A0A1Y1UJR0_9TREE|nr:hypothetical protein BD324DRAFT_649601 [Kockovaella imperatae]ORX38222.1 hypothetical protein BD324DRAFT_649601 [Kockovaella imperatae]
MPKPGVNERKASGKSTSGPNGASTFYNGPTVSATARDMQQKAKVVARDVAKDVKQTTRRVKATARRHPWSIISILTTIPFLLTISLFSTVICPPPSTPSSSISKFFLTPLGLHKEPSTLHQTLCYPANVYHREVLQPYIYPILDDLQSRATAHPFYLNAIEPVAKNAQTTATQLWEGPIRPIVNRISRGARKLYLTYVSPHIPWARAKWYTLTSPYTSRASKLYRTHAEPHVKTASKYARSAADSSVNTYNFIAGHPLTGHAGRYANQAYHFSRQKSVQGYTWARPHAIRAGKEGQRIAKEIIFPKLKEGYMWADAQLSRGRAIVRAYIVKQYNTHLDPVLGPHIKRMQVILDPYISAFDKQVFIPYIKPLVEKIIPAPLLAEAPPRSFWTLISEILPSPEGGRAAQRRGSMDSAYDKAAQQKQKAAEGVASAMSKINKATQSIKSAASSATPSAKVFDRAEMDRVRDALKKRVDERGAQGLKDTRQKLLDHHRSILSDSQKLPLLANNAREEISRDIDYILAGLDKLYTQSTSLTKEQVEASSKKSEDRLAKKVTTAKERGEKMKIKWNDEGKSFVKEAMDSLNALFGKEWEDLKLKMSGIADLSPKDWTKFDALKKSGEEWESKYLALQRGETKDKALSAKDANINTAIAELSTELDDRLAGFKERLSTLKRTAADRIEARQAVAAESAAGSPATPSSASKSQTSSESRVSILPIEQETMDVVVDSAIIGKGRQQVVDALSAAEAAASKASATASSAVSDQSGTIGSVVSQAQASASSISDAASSVVHDATRSVVSAVGGTPSPEGASEHLESIGNAVKQGHASVVSGASDKVESAIASVKEAVGNSDSTQSIKGRAEDVVSSASVSASSLASEAFDTGSSITSIASETLVSIQSEASASASSLSAKAKSIVPERPSISSSGIEVISSASSFLSSASSVGSQSLASASSIGSKSVASGVSKGSESASSLISQVSSGVHSVTREAARAAGATPFPENAGEYVEAATDAVKSVIGDASRSVESGASAVKEGVHQGTEHAKQVVASARDEL